MNVHHARLVLLHSVMDDDGTFVCLRLGQNPGTERIRELRKALQVLQQNTIDMESMHREIVYACAVIIHFKEECYLNMRDGSATSVEDLRADLDALAQAAFMGFNWLKNARGLKKTNMLVLIGVTTNKLQERDQHVREFTLPCLGGSRL